MSMLSEAGIESELKRISTIISGRIAEHKVEVEGCGRALLSIQQDLKSQISKPDFNKVKELGIIKDKMIFHKSIVAALADLLEAIK